MRLAAKGSVCGRELRGSCAVGQDNPAGEGAPGGGRATARYYRADQLLPGERFGHVIGHARLPGRLLVSHVGAGRQHDHGNRGRPFVGLELLENLQPIGVGQHQIQHHDIGQELARQHHGLRPGAPLAYLKTRRLQL